MSLQRWGLFMFVTLMFNRYSLVQQHQNRTDSLFRVISMLTHKIERNEHAKKGFDHNY